MKINLEEQSYKMYFLIILFTSEIKHIFLKPDRQMKFIEEQTLENSNMNVSILGESYSKSNTENDKQFHFRI
jgi:hypothetical protein